MDIIRRADKIGLLFCALLLIGLFLEWIEGFSIGQIIISGISAGVVIILVWYNLSERPELRFTGTVIEGYNMLTESSAIKRKWFWKVRTTSLEAKKTEEPIRISVKDDIANIGFREVMVHEYEFYYPDFDVPLKDGPHPLFEEDIPFFREPIGKPFARLLLQAQSRKTVASIINLPQGLFRIQIKVVATTLKATKTIWCYVEGNKINWLEPNIATRISIKIFGRRFLHKLLNLKSARNT